MEIIKGRQQYESDEGRYQAGRFLIPLAAVNSLNPGNSILDLDELLLGTATSSISVSSTGEEGHEGRLEGSNFNGGRVMGGEEDLETGIDKA